jgi:hypothetical protein
VNDWVKALIAIGVGALLACLLVFALVGWPW